MSENNQTEKIKNFISSKDRNLLINDIKDDITIFFVLLLEFYAKAKNFKITYDHIIENNDYENDLFGEIKLKIYKSNSSKIVENLLNKSEKKLIITDYKNFKKYSKEVKSINTYQYESDIVNFIKNELKIDDEELIFYCKNNPALLFSETSKYLINKNLYTCDLGFKEERNHILEIRKSIFELKKNNLNIKNLYLNLKTEVSYKKLNFLTY